MNETSTATNRITRAGAVGYLALPVAVVLDAVGQLIVQLVITSSTARGNLTALSGLMTVATVLVSVLVMALCAAAVTSFLRSRRAGHPRPRGWAVAGATLTASLLLTSLYALAWYSGIGAGLLMATQTNLVVSTLGMLLAAAALVAGAIAAAGHRGRPGAGALTLAAVATPAALLTPILGSLFRQTAMYTVSVYAGLALALLGLAAAVVAARQHAPTPTEELPDAGPAGSWDGTGPAGVQRPATAARSAESEWSSAAGWSAESVKPAAAAEPEWRGRRFLRHVATPLGMACLVLILPLMDALEAWGLAILLLVAAAALAIAAIVGAVLDFRSLAGTGEPRAGHLTGDVAVPASVLVVPASLALGGLMGGGWAVLGALVIGAGAAVLCALVGLVGVLYSVFSGRYVPLTARVSTLATALVFVAAASFLPLQDSGAGLVSFIAAGALLLLAVVAGLVTVLSLGPSLRSSLRLSPQSSPQRSPQRSQRPVPPLGPQNPYR
ncbi:hypothetical protein [Microbacterium sp. A93]|uniref:hypothetical protein n=1 Tax=Microbacterium sp. A93 TaxID=3450716 RepID=UPI003F43DFED